MSDTQALRISNLLQLVETANVMRKFHTKSKPTSKIQEVQHFNMPEAKSYKKSANQQWYEKCARNFTSSKLAQYTSSLVAGNFKTNTEPVSPDGEDSQSDENGRGGKGPPDEREIGGEWGGEKAQVYIEKELVTNSPPLGR